MLVVAGATGLVLDAEDGAVIRTLPTRQAHGVQVAFSPDGARVAIGGLVDAQVSPEALAIFDLEGDRAPDLLVGFDELAVTAVDFDPRGERVVHGSARGAAEVWHLASRARLATLTGGGPVIQARFDPTGACAPGLYVGGL